MDLEQQLIRRRKELDDQKSILQRLRNAKRTESEIEQHAGVKSDNEIDSFGSEIRGNTFSTVNHVHQVGVNFPPLSSDGAMHSRATKAKKTFADVLGDAKFSYGEGALHVGEEVGALEASVDTNLDQEDMNELSSKALASRVTLRDEKWSIHRPVNALRFHQKHEDLLLSAHATSSVATSERSGVVNVWALDGGDSCLQRTLIANASMTSLVLPSISPATVVGGTYGGDLLTWDLRARASTPAQRAGSFSVDPDFSHSCSPIFSLEMASGNKAELISASANGTICVWSLSNLDSPVMKFQVRNQSLTGTIRVTALEVPSMKKFMGGGRENKSSQYLFAGGEDGGVYRFENQSGSWGLGRETAAHKAPVTSLSVHPTSRKWPQLSDIVLSASMDWSVQLCNLGQGSLSGPPKTYSIGMPGIISDVKWSPVHPCIFASGDEAGGVSLFDAERSYMNSGPPSCRHTFKESGNSASATSSITRLQWSKDGRQLSAGDIEGSVSIWRCSENIADSSSQEWERMSDFLKRRSDK